ncbi:MAG: hypothetical protein M1833_003279 [Piccolia ochrophora]|nr:MAG: hypothetical protein M1833_003279 [Piccolia ochrophora]
MNHRELFLKINLGPAERGRSNATKDIPHVGLSFRDDTPRIVERMQEVSIAGSSVWDPHSDSRDSSRAPSSPDDSLPPFSALTNDEDRERKAESQDPGTFHVVVNPHSFSGLPEYSEADSASDHDRRDGTRDKTSVDGILDGVSESSPHHEASEDPNVVIISRFDDATRRATSQAQQPSSRSPPLREPTSTTASQSTEASTECFNESKSPINDRIGEDRSHLTLQEKRLLEHYRNFISHQLIYTVHGDAFEPLPRADRVEGDRFEQEAESFRPLLHAMMALSALSYNYQDGLRSIDALQHYQQALPSLQSSLKSPRDLSSDGALFAQFFLLLYEIATAEQWGSSHWLQHLAQVLRIVLIRFEMFGQERHFLVIWFLSVIDTYALLSGGSSGDFVESIIKNDMMPVPERHPSPPFIPPALPCYPSEQETFTPVLLFNQRILNLAVRLGRFAKHVRGQLCPPSQDEQSFPGAPQDIANWRDEAMRIQEALRSVWESDTAACIQAGSSSLTPGFSPRVQAIYDQACLLYWACLIYSHTSIWPSQRAHSGVTAEEEIHTCVMYILEMAKVLVPAKQLELRFVAFPVFMAGFAATSGDEKMTALDLIATVENVSIGRNTTIVRRLLQAVFERQNERIMSVGQTWDVDWIDIMIERGLQGVKFGL